MTDGTRSAFAEKRQFCRLSLPLQVYINTKNKNSDRLYNISEGGACFQSSHTFNTDDFIFFHFHGNDKSDIEGMKFTVLGKIVWNEEKEGHPSSYGAQFTFHNDPFSKQQHTKMMSVINRFSSKN